MPLSREPCAVKVACTVLTGGLGKRAVRQRALILPTCLVVRRNSSHRIPDESGEDSEDILEVSRLTGAERQKGQAHGGKAGGAEKAQTAQTRKTCMGG